MAQLAAVADVNNDGNPDILSGVARDATNKNTTASFAKDTNEVMLNDGRGHFSFATASDPATNTESTLNQVVFTDVDNDGKIDLFFTYRYSNPADTSRAVGNQPQLYKGNGDGTFSTITLPAGLGLADSGSFAPFSSGTNARPAFGAMACDSNGDGHPDLCRCLRRRIERALRQRRYGRLPALGPGRRLRRRHRRRLPRQRVLPLLLHRAREQRVLHRAAAPESAARRQPAATGRPASATRRRSPTATTSRRPAATWTATGGSTSSRAPSATGRAGLSTDPSTLLINRTAPNGGIELDRVPGTEDGVVFPHIDPQGWNEGIQQTALVDMDNDGRPDILNGGSD